MIKKMNFADMLQVSGLFLLQSDRTTQKLIAQNASTKGLKTEKMQKTLHIARIFKSVEGPQKICRIPA